MSLTGNLEDLPLLDIIQIVSFSKKTGALSIRTEEGEGGIVFREGFVVCAFAAGTPPLDRRFDAVSLSQRDSAIHSRIAIALERLIRLREGQFSFTLAERPPGRLGAREIAGETLSSGINPQELLLDLARGMDEDRRDSTAAVEAAFAEPEEPPPTVEDPAAAPRAADAGAAAVRASVRGTGLAPSAGRQGSGATLPVPVVPPAPSAGAAEPAAARAVPGGAPIRSILLADDEDDVRGVLGGWFRKGGFQVLEAENPETAVKTGGRLGKEGTPFILVTDLAMPTSGGSSFQGGFEVVKRLWKMNLRPPVLMMTETLSQGLQLRARQMGIKAFVFKPGLSKLNPKQFEADLQAFAQKMIADVLPKLARVPAARPAKRAAGSGLPAGTPTPGEEELSREFSFLQRRLAELRQPGNANQIAVLVVKVAREFFERGILFLVKNEEARGLGGFGLAPRGESLSLLVRRVVLPLGEPSALQEVVQSGKSYAGVLPLGRWSNHLTGRVGRFQAGEIALLPLVAHRETIAVLYGDNPETGRPISRLPALEVFVHQAGIALENAFLQRKLQSMQDKGGP